MSTCGHCKEGLNRSEPGPLCTNCKTAGVECPSPPGDILRAWLNGRNVSVKNFAQRANLSFTLVKLLLIGAYPINEVIAERLAQATGIGTEEWLDLENAYQAALDEQGMRRPRPT